MRSSKSRSRSKGNRNRSMGNIVNRVFDSSGPEGKVRGTPQQIIDKYNQLARDAQLGNDRVAAENFQQHAEHYLRMLAEAQREQQERQQQNQGGNQQGNDQGQNETQSSQQEDQRQDNNQASGQDNDWRSGEGRRNRGLGRDRNAPESNPAQNVAQPDIIDMGEPEEGGLVETPEDKPKRPRRSRNKPAVSESDAPAAQPSPQDAAE